MDTAVLFAIVAALFGTIAGSFLNALLFRYNTGVSVLRGRSKCMHCGHTLHAADLVPLLSYLSLGGRCRYCASRVSWQYPLVEAAAGLAAAVLYLQQLPPLQFALAALLWATLLFVFVYDLKHQIIPWGASGLLAALALAHVWMSGFDVWALAAGPLLAAPLLLLSLVSCGRWMGWGDGILELGIGWFLGLSAGLTAFVLAFWIGAGVGIALMLARTAYTMKSEVPFAPFLILGAACAYFLHVDFFQTLAALFL